MEARLDAIRREGYPVTLAELDQWYKQPPAGENAADVLTNAFARLHPWDGNDKRFKQLPLEGRAALPPRGEPLPADTKQLIAEYLAENQEALDFFHQGATMKQCRYPIDLSKPPRKLDHLNAMRRGCRILFLEALLHVENAEPELAAGSVATSVGLGRSLSNEPLLISHLLRLACDYISASSLETGLNRIPLPDASLAQLQEAFTEADNPQASIRALVGERCNEFQKFGRLGEHIERNRKLSKQDQEIFGMAGSFLLVRPAYFLYRVSGGFELDELCYLEMMDQYLKAAKSTLPERLQKIDAVKKREVSLPRYAEATRLKLGGISNALINDLRHVAKMRAVVTALAIERHRLSKGALPDRLDQLAPTYLDAVPVDPFDGKPIRYKRLPKGYVIYSVGDDGNDDGGSEKDSQGRSYVLGTDIPFTVER